MHKQQKREKEREKRNERERKINKSTQQLSRTYLAVVFEATCLSLEHVTAHAADEATRLYVLFDRGLLVTKLTESVCARERGSQRVCARTKERGSINICVSNKGELCVSVPRIIPNTMLSKMITMMIKKDKSKKKRPAYSLSL